ncbi:MAG: AsmA-like C-terminal domain-containing protein [Bdellovibrionales bacterium]
MLHTAKKFLEGIAALVGIMVLLAALAIWRLHVSPISSNILTPYLEAGIERLIPGTKASIGHSLLTWDNGSRSLAIYADNLRITGTQDEPILEVPHLDARIGLLGILIGQFLPNVLNVEHPQLRLVHGKDGRLSLPGIARPPLLTQEESQPPSKDGHQATREIVRHLAATVATARLTKKLGIMRAVIDVRDDAGRSVWSVSVPEISLTRRRGELGGLATVELTQGDSLSKLNLHYLYDNKKRLHEVTTRFNSITPALLAGGHPENLGFGAATMVALPLTGDISIKFDDALAVATLDAQVHGDKGSLNVPAFWDGARAIAALDASLSYDRSAGLISLAPVHIDFGGPTLDLTASGRLPKILAQDSTFELDVTLRNWPMDEFKNLWPKTIIPNARAWIVGNMSGGVFEHGKAQFKGVMPQDKPEDIAVSEGRGTINASHARVSYIDGMPPVEDVSAKADFDLATMTVAVSGGGIGAIKIVPFTVTMRGLNESLQMIDIPLQVSGPVRDILRLIDNPPLGYAKAVDLDPNLFAGRAMGTVKLRFPMLKALSVKDIEVSADANLLDVAASNLFKGVNLSRGALNFSLTGKGFAIKGPTELNGVPLQIEWQQVFEPKGSAPRRKASLAGRVTSEQWQAFGMPIMASSTKDEEEPAHAAVEGGFTNVTVQITEPRDAPIRVHGVLDMTKANFVFEPLNWHKSPKTSAILTFDANIAREGAIEVQSIDLRGPQIQVKGNATLSPEGKLLALNLDPFVLGRSDAALRYASPVENGVDERIEITGQAFDISGLRGGKEPGHSSPASKEYKLKLGKLLTSDIGFVSDAEGYAKRDREGWTAISFHGMADSGHKLDIDLTPQADGTRTLSITCDDFGKALKGLGFTDAVKDGPIEIRGESATDNPRAIEGTVKIGHFLVKDLPFLMLLLNATSPFGLTGLLTDSASFDRLDGKFRWEGETIELRHIHAAGTSTGMNVEGKVNLDTGEARLRGTIVPFGTVNKLIGAVPLLGDIITGGEDGGILAVSYTLRGTLDDPDINVNPVSLLTPGFLRNLFFGGNDDAEDDKLNSKLFAPNDDERKPETPNNLKNGHKEGTSK